MMRPILHNALPPDQAERAAARLPSMAPVEGPWLTWDETYSAQMALRRRLLTTRSADVLAQLSEGLAAAKSCLDAVLDALPPGFHRSEQAVICPDGHRVTLERDAPLQTLGQILQQDVCILEKRGEEHVLTGGVLCFPASWTLTEKIGRPLTGIHGPVPEYDANIAARVQRFFNGVQQGRPMWRANLLRYEDPSLYHPRPEGDPRPNAGPGSRFLRSERQTVLRLSHPGAVAFFIHTVVVEAPLKDDECQHRTK